MVSDELGRWGRVVSADRCDFLEALCRVAEELVPPSLEEVRRGRGARARVAVWQRRGAEAASAWQARWPSRLCDQRCRGLQVEAVLRTVRGLEGPELAAAMVRPWLAYYSLVSRRQPRCCAPCVCAPLRARTGVRALGRA